MKFLDACRSVRGRRFRWNRSLGDFSSVKVEGGQVGGVRYLGREPCETAWSGSVTLVRSRGILVGARLLDPNHGARMAY